MLLAHLYNTGVHFAGRKSGPRMSCSSVISYNTRTRTDAILTGEWKPIKKPLKFGRSPSVLALQDVAFKQTKYAGVRFWLPEWHFGSANIIKDEDCVQKCIPDDIFIIYDKNDSGHRDLGRPIGFWGPGGRVATGFKILKSHIGFTI